MTKKNNAENTGNAGKVSVFFIQHYRMISLLFVGIAVVSVMIYIGIQYDRERDREKLLNLQLKLQEEKWEFELVQDIQPTKEAGDEDASLVETVKMLPAMERLFEKNEDVIGWLMIPDTNINYPVMQTLEEEEYYLRRDFEGNKNRNGTLFADTDSVIGKGTQKMDYTFLGEDGSVLREKPSTNLMIYGHTMKSGEMFGKLNQYQDIEYGMEHKSIYFTSLYEEREYEVISVIYSKIYTFADDVFKYYKFFQADTEEEFQYWYENIKEKSLYDTGVEAQFGDEFITLSCCSYHVENGRFAVIGKRVK